jgi:hypothetical protein
LRKRMLASCASLLCSERAGARSSRVREDRSRAGIALTPRSVSRGGRRPRVPRHAHGARTRSPGPSGPLTRCNRDQSRRSDRDDPLIAFRPHRPLRMRRCTGPRRIRGSSPATGRWSTGRGDPSSNPTSERTRRPLRIRRRTRRLPACCRPPARCRPPRRPARPALRHLRGRRNWTRSCLQTALPSWIQSWMRHPRPRNRNPLPRPPSWIQNRIPLPSLCCWLQSRTRRRNRSTGPAPTWRPRRRPPKSDRVPGAAAED